MHVMAVHWEEIVPRLVAESGLPRPVVRSLAEAGGPPPEAKKPAPAVQVAG
jgi:hypothetical protein